MSRKIKQPKNRNPVARVVKQIRPKVVPSKKNNFDTILDKNADTNIFEDALKDRGDLQEYVIKDLAHYDREHAMHIIMAWMSFESLETMVNFFKERNDEV